MPLGRFQLQHSCVLAHHTFVGAISQAVRWRIQTIHADRSFHQSDNTVTSPAHQTYYATNTECVRFFQRRWASPPAIEASAAAVGAAYGSIAISHDLPPSAMYIRRVSAGWTSMSAHRREKMSSSDNKRHLSRLASWNFRFAVLRNIFGIPSPHQADSSASANSSCITCCLRRQPARVMPMTATVHAFCRRIAHHAGQTPDSRRAWLGHTSPPNFVPMRGASDARPRCGAGTAVLPEWLSQPP